MTIRHYAFGNIGRRKGPQSTNVIDMDALMALRVNVPNEETAIFLCEINEGDKNNELKLVQTAFKGWRIYCRRTREPILLSPDQPKAKSRVLWVPNSAVEHWSPRRSVNIVHLADEPESLVGGHPAAGANGQGTRPKKYLGPLQVSWDNWNHKFKQVKTRLHKRGRNVTSMLDYNAYNRDVFRLLPGEQVVWNDATDWGLVFPAENQLARFHDGGKVDFKIDSHDGHTMWGRYIKK